MAIERFSVIITSLMCVSVVLAEPSGNPDGKNPSLAQRALRNQLFSGDGLRCLAEKTGVGYSEEDLSVLVKIANSASGKGILGDGECYVQVTKKAKGKSDHYSVVHVYQGSILRAFPVQPQKAETKALVAGGIGFAAGLTVAYQVYKKFGRGNNPGGEG